MNRRTAATGALDGARELATTIAANGPLAVAMTRRMVSESAAWPVDGVWDRQSDFVEGVLATDDANQGAAAFAEKRPPVWTGR